MARPRKNPLPAQKPIPPPEPTEKELLQSVLLELREIRQLLTQKAEKREESFGEWLRNAYSLPS